MATTLYPNPAFEEAALGTQSALGTLATTPSGATPGRIVKVDLTPEVTEEPYKDKHGRTMVGSRKNAETATWALEALLRPSDTLGQDPHHSLVLSKGGFTEQTNTSTTVAASPSPTTTTFDVASASNLAVGQLIKISNTTDGEIIRQISALSGTSVTVRPAMTSAPTASDAVDNGDGWLENTTQGSNLDIFTLYRWILTDQIAVGEGCFVDTISIEAGQDANVVLKADGPARKVSMGHRGQLNGAIGSTSSTSITVDDGSLYDVNVPIYIGTEAMLVTAVSGQTLTVTRGYDGTTAATHSDNDPVLAYKPTLSYAAATPISSLDVDVYVWEGDGNAPILLGAGQANLSIKNGAKVIGPAMGETVAAHHFTTSDRREITFELNAWLTVGDGSSKEARWIRNGLAADTVGVMVVAGTPSSAGGGVFAWIAPTAKVQAPAIDTGADGEIPITISGNARGTTSEDDEFAMAGF